MAAPRGRTIRPTADKVREAVFNILESRFLSMTDISVLDLCAGSGALGIEALSRGAAEAVFVDNSREGTELVARNLASLGFKGAARVVARDAESALKAEEARGGRFQLVFLDPPYAQGLATRLLSVLAASTLIDEESVVVAEFSSREELATSFGSLHEADRRIYGDTAVAFFTRS